MNRARSLFPGGVSSPVRAFRGVGGEPFVVDRGEGPYVWDVDGNRYIDFVLSWGALPLGHAHPAVIAAISDAMRVGTSFGIPSERELLLGELIRERMPHVEMLRFVSSGTEATMSAIRLARAATGRERFLKFAGCYHGHADSFLVKAGSGVATLGLPDSPGVPAALARLTHTCEFNDTAAVEQVLSEFGNEVAAVILEPIIGNSGFILPQPDFLAAVARLARAAGALLIFDEVMTGFRVSPGGAAALYDVTPDLTTLGKVIGGGMPVAAYGGRAELMRQIAPEGPVYQAGTLSGNPISMASGAATLSQLDSDAHTAVEDCTRRLVTGLSDAAARAGVDMVADSRGSMWGFFLSRDPITSYADARSTDVARFRRLFHAARERGVYLAPSAFEAAFMSTAHEAAVVDDALNRLEDALRAVAS